MTLKQIVLCIFALFSLSSCVATAKDFRLDAMNGFELGGATMSQARLTIKLAVANDARATLTVREGLMTLSDEKGDIADLLLDEEVVLRKRRSNDIRIPLIVRFSGALGTAQAIPRLMGADKDKLRLNGTVKIRNGAIGKTVKLKDVPVTEFLRMIGVSEADINLPK